MKKLVALLLAMIMVFSFCACSNGTDNNTNNTQITVCLDWTPNTNHTGLYVALVNGYYEQAGLDVTIVQPPENGATQACAANQAQFAIDAQDTLAAAFALDNPLEVTAVAALIQHNSSGIISLAGQGMDSPRGITGNTYLTWDSPIEKAMMENVVNADGGDWSQVTLEPNTVTNEAFHVKENPDDCVWVFYGWSGINAQVCGVDTDYFAFKDINPVFDYYTPILIANNEFLASNPDEARAFLDATEKGYQYAIDNPEEAAQILIDADETKSLVGSEELVVASQKWLSSQYVADAEKWGYIDPERWNAFYQWLNTQQLVENPLADNTGFTNDYL